MTVPASKRKMSKIEFYNRAMKFHSRIADLIRRDFGHKINMRATAYVSNKIKMDPEDEAVFNSICVKNNIHFDNTQDSLFLDYYKNKALALIDGIVNDIVSANSIYATRESEFDYRRRLQWDAICKCNMLLTTFQLLENILQLDANKLTPYVEDINNELKLLKDWKKSDNNILKQIQLNNSKKQEQLVSSEESNNPLKAPTELIQNQLYM